MLARRNTYSVPSIDPSPTADATRLILPPGDYWVVRSGRGYSIKNLGGQVAIQAFSMTRKRSGTSLGIRVKAEGNRGDNLVSLHGVVLIRTEGSRAVHARRTASTAAVSTSCNAAQSRGPSPARSRRCVRSHASVARWRARRPSAASSIRRSLASLPSTRRIHLARSNGLSVRLSVVLSTAKKSPSAPCVIGAPAVAKTCRRVNCVIRSPLGRRAASYSWVTARAARRMLAQAQGREGTGGVGANAFRAMFICVCTCPCPVKRVPGNCGPSEPVVSNGNHMYIHPYE